MPTLIAVCALSLGAVGLAMSSPMHFWTKCVPVFGILFPCIAFRVVFLCPAHNSSGLALSKPDFNHPPFYVYAALMAGAALGFAKAVSKFTVVDSSVQLNTESDETTDSSVTERLLLQCSSFKTTLWNLTVYLLTFGAILVSIASWRIAFSHPQSS
jgi:hypothetical protein